MRENDRLQAVDITFLIIIFTALINISLGIIVYNRNPKSITGRLLAGLTIIFAFWGITNYFSLNSESITDTLFWIRTVMFVTAPLGPVLYFFTRTFPHSKKSISKKEIYPLVFLTVIVQIISFTPFIFSSVTIENGNITPAPEAGIILFAILFTGAPIAGFIELIRKYRKSAGIERLQIKYLIFGILVTFILLISTNFIAVILFQYSGFVIFGPIFSLIFVGFLTYAIIKHRLLELRDFIAKTVTYFLLIFIVVSIYAFGLFFISQYFFQTTIDLNRTIGGALLAIVVAFTFIPLRNTVESITNKVFFKGRYSQRKLTVELSHIAASSIDIEKLTSKFLTKLVAAFNITHGALIIFSNKNTFTVFSFARKDDTYSRKSIKKLLNLKKTLIHDEESTPRLRHILEELDAEIIFPLFERGSKIGLLLLGKKRSGEIYSQRDITTLEILGPAIAVAIQNAKSYEEISRFNITLRNEVKRAIKDLKKVNEKLREVSKQKDDFMAIASHELKTPITSMKLHTHLLERKFKKNNDFQSAIEISKMDKQVDKLTNLINDLLDVTKIEEGRLRYNKEYFDINYLITDVVEEMQMTTKQKIVRELGSEKWIYADRERIGQVLTNFISNAIKYSPNGDKIIVSSEDKDEKVQVNVKDFGVGLSKRENEKVFERFYRSTDKNKEGYPGMGLGLYIAGVIIKDHGGEVSAAGRKNKGSTFSFTLPLVEKK